MGARSIKARTNTRQRRGEDGDASVCGLSWQNQRAVRRPTAGEGLFEVGSLSAAARSWWSAARGAGESAGVCGRRAAGSWVRVLRASDAVGELWSLCRWQAGGGFAEPGQVDGIDCSVEEALGVFLEGGEGLFAAAGRLMRAGETNGGVDGFGFDEVGRNSGACRSGSRAQRFVHGAELEFGERVVELQTPVPLRSEQRRPRGSRRVGIISRQFLAHMVLVGVEIEAEAGSRNLVCAAGVVKAGALS